MLCVFVQAAVYPRVHNLTHPLPKLDMRVHCLYGTGKDTDERFEYDVPNFSSSEPPAPRRAVQGPGDGTVNLRSLELGMRYAILCYILPRHALRIAEACDAPQMSKLRAS